MGKFDDIDILFISLIGSYLTILVILFLTIVFKTFKKRFLTKKTSSNKSRSQPLKPNTKHISSKKKENTTKKRKTSQVNNSTNYNKGYISPTKKKKHKKKGKKKK